MRRISLGLSIALGIAGTLLVPPSASAQALDIEPEALTWARVDFLRNRVQLVPKEQRGRRARISDILSVGDSLRTARESRAELRFNDGSLARIGERATFRFTPNTRNFQLSNGTVLLLIPPGRGRSTIQTPNAVTGIQGSALFVRYIPETDTTIVGALTDNPNGPMVLFNRDGSEQQALRANEIGVIEGNQITELYQFDGTLFWQSSGLAEGFNYLTDSSSTGSDALDGVRQEIRDAISNQAPLNSDSVIVNPDSFTRPEPTESPGVSQPSPVGATPGSSESGQDPSLGADGTTTVETGIDADLEESEGPALEFQNSPAQEYLQGSIDTLEEEDLEIGVNNSLAPAVSQGSGTTADAQTEDEQDTAVDATPAPNETEGEPARLPVTDDDADVIIADPDNKPSVISGPGASDDGSSNENPTVQPLPPNALTDDSPSDEAPVDEAPTDEAPSDGVPNSDASTGDPVEVPVNQGDVPDDSLILDETPGDTVGDSVIEVTEDDLNNVPNDVPNNDSDLIVPESSEPPSNELPSNGLIDNEEITVPNDGAADAADLETPISDVTVEGPVVEDLGTEVLGTEVPDTEVPDTEVPGAEVPGGELGGAPTGSGDFLLLEETGPTELQPLEVLEESTIPPTAPDAAPQLVEDPTLDPLPSQVEKIDELPTPEPMDVMESGEATGSDT
ncbi:MAG: FecR domain-containing protein [Cyanobacteria bacterium J06614_10]